MSTQQAQATQAIAGRARWEIDPVHSEIGFAVRHMMVATARGRFGEFSGHVDFDPAEPTGASVEVSINAKSIDTRNPDRDAHLRSPDFFDAENHPTITFKSRRIEAVGGDQYRVIGDLTIRGVTREVVLDTTYYGVHPDAFGGIRAGFHATTSINRFDFGLNWNAAIEAGGVVVADTVNITIDLEVVRQ
ncbi:YceI family protein [Sphaerobacter thermophilus]|uniref:YceI family protein n=1 Tax=Sphaerobacter thermophilus (strain ATCC 49802 / DSM 20745 / KCCM 41009 / NCIMB 13125 / S 6022) TaxID=479434 RepID=D1C603_SPHTD|nr:YceI family protein [Sphaerobacter thermophilus]ACZ39555.1 YceI family protein [Sphaerobacter thermophilus DSM 20745]